MKFEFFLSTCDHIYALDSLYPQILEPLPNADEAFLFMIIFVYNLRSFCCVLISVDVLAFALVQRA
jgi:hypothetical protein